MKRQQLLAGAALLTTLGGVIAGPASASEPPWKTLWKKGTSIAEVQVMAAWDDGKQMLYSERFVRDRDAVKTYQLDCRNKRFRLLNSPSYHLLIEELGVEKAKQWLPAESWKTPMILCRGIDFYAFD